MNIMNNLRKNIFSKNSLFNLTHSTKMFNLNFQIMKNNFSVFYTLNKCAFARNVRSPQGIKNISDTNEEIEKEKEKEKDIGVVGEVGQPFTKESLKTENISNIIRDFYTKAKQFQIYSPNDLFFENEDNVEIYNFIVSNLKLVKDDRSLDLLLRALGYFKIVDNKTIDILSKCLVFAEKNKKTKLSMLTFYIMVKLNIRDENIQTKSLNLIKDTDFHLFEKEAVNPFIWALSDREISIKELNEKIDDYVKIKIEDLNEYELSIIFRFYSKIFYFNYETLEIILVKCLKFCPKLSLRYILIITKCLAEMNIRNLNLLAGIQERMNVIIKQNEMYATTKVDEFNFLTPDTICQLLSNLVKLEFIEFEDFNKYEKLFFELAEKNGINNKESIFSILSTHCKYITKLFKELSEKKKDNVNENNETDPEIQNFKKYEKTVKKEKKSSIKIKKEYKQTNENFFEKIMPYLNEYKNEMNFHTALNLMVIFKNLQIYKRKNLRSLLEFYVNCIDKFFSKEIKENKAKVNFFIECGFKIFDYEGQKKEIIEKFKLYNIEYEKFLIKEENYRANKEERKEKKNVEKDESE